MGKKILFLCTGNSCRSQMAEAWARQLLPSQLEVFSAGSEPHGLNPRAVRVMQEVGIDISRQQSKHVSSLSSIQFDWVITVCENAAKTCPLPPSTKQVIHVAFDDPPRLAKELGEESQILEVYRRVRDQIKQYIGTLAKSLNFNE